MTIEESAWSLVDEIDRAGNRLEHSIRAQMVGRQNQPTRLAHTESVRKKVDSGLACMMRCIRSGNFLSATVHGEATIEDLKALGRLIEQWKEAQNKIARVAG